MSDEVFSVSSGQEKCIHPPSPVPMSEFELPDDSSESTPPTELPEVPRFEENRHEGIKMFVMVWAIGTLVWMIFQALWKIPRQYHRFYCGVLYTGETCDDVEEMGFSEFLTVFIRFYMEILAPFTVLLMLVLCQLMITAFPRLTTRIRNPIPTVLSLIYITCFFYTTTNFLTAATMLTNVELTRQSSVRMEYVMANASALYWMFSFLNMLAFSQLTTFNYIRAKEKWEMRERQQENI